MRGSGAFGPGEQVARGGEDEGTQRSGGGGARGGGGGGGRDVHALRARSGLLYGEGPRGDGGHYYYDERDYHGSGRTMEYAARPRARPEDWYYKREPTGGSSSLSSSTPGSVGPRGNRYAPPSDGRFHTLRGSPSDDAMAPRSSTLESLLRGGGGGRDGGGGDVDDGRLRRARPGGDSGADGPMTTAAAGGGRAASSSAAGTSERPAKPRGRSTPYLTESNRQDIMERIRRGEKQADLAKEYNVSRAAITNLKQRRQMLEMLENSSNAKDREEALKRRRLSHGNSGLASHSPSTVGEDGGSEDGPRDQRKSRERVARTRSGSDGNESADSGGDKFAAGGRAEDELETVPLAFGDAAASATEGESCETVLAEPLAAHRELNVHTTSRLLATLWDATTPDAAFRSAATRLARLLVEETIGWSFSRAPQHYEPYALARGGDEAASLLAEYLQLEPASPSTTLRTVQQRASSDEIEIVARVPSSALRHGPVFVFVDDLVELERPREDVSTDTGRASDTTTTTTADGDQQTLHNHDANATLSGDTHSSGATPRATRDLLFVLHSLVFAGLPESEIVVVVTLCDARVARELGQRFPSVKLVTTRLLSGQMPPHEQSLVAAYRARRQAMMRSDNKERMEVV